MVTIKTLDSSEMESILICSDGAWKCMFDTNKLKPEVYEMLSKNEYVELRDYLIKQECFDDYSFISMDLNEISGGRKAA